MEHLPLPGGFVTSVTDPEPVVLFTKGPCIYRFNLEWFMHNLVFYCKSVQQHPS